MAERIPVYYLVGKPGAGKGSQGPALEELLGVPSLSAGEVLREEAKQPTERGKMVAEIQAASGLVPYETVVEVLEDAVKADKYAKGVILDGLPRSLEQDDWVGTWGQVKAIFNIDVPDDICTKRIMGRAARPEDSDPVKIAKRLREDISHKILERYTQKGTVPIYHIDGTGTIEQVTELLKKQYAESPA